MTQATIRVAIKNSLDAVASIGAVHDYRRFSNEWDEFLRLFKITIDGIEQLRGWTIGYDGFASGIHEFGQLEGGNVRTHRFTIRGYLGLSDGDETEKTAATLAELVANTLDNDTTIHGGGFYYAPRAELRTFDDRVFGSALCHYAEIIQEVSEWIA